MGIEHFAGVGLAALLLIWLAFWCGTRWERRVWERIYGAALRDDMLPGGTFMTYRNEIDPDTLTLEYR